MRLNNKRHVGRLGFVFTLITILLALPFIGLINFAVLGQETVVTLTPVLETRYIVTIDGRNAFVRDCPSTECEILKAVPNRSSVYVTGLSDTWLRIRLSDGRTGYVAEYLTSLVLPTFTPTLEPIAQFPAAPNGDSNCATVSVHFPVPPTDIGLPETPGATDLPSPNLPPPCITIVFETPHRMPTEMRTEVSEPTTLPTQQISPSPSSTQGS